MRTVSVENDKSAPLVEADAKLDTSAGSFVNSRRKSLSQIENNFKGMDAESAAKLNEGVETDDRSHANVELILDQNEPPTVLSAAEAAAESAKPPASKPSWMKADDGNVPTMFKQKRPAVSSAAAGTAPAIPRGRRRRDCQPSHQTAALPGQW